MGASDAHIIYYLSPSSRYHFGARRAPFARRAHRAPRPVLMPGPPCPATNNDAELASPPASGPPAGVAAGGRRGTGARRATPRSRPLRQDVDATPDLELVVIQSESSGGDSEVVACAPPCAVTVEFTRCLSNHILARIRQDLYPRLPNGYQVLLSESFMLVLGPLHDVQTAQEVADLASEVIDFIGGLLRSTEVMHLPELFELRRDSSATTRFSPFIGESGRRGIGPQRHLAQGAVVREHTPGRPSVPPVGQQAVRPSASCRATSAPALRPQPAAPGEAVGIAAAQEGTAGVAAASGVAAGVAAASGGAAGVAAAPGSTTCASAALEVAARISAVREVAAGVAAASGGAAGVAAAQAGTASVAAASGVAAGVAAASGKAVGVAAAAQAGAAGVDAADTRWRGRPDRDDAQTGPPPGGARWRGRPTGAAGQQTPPTKAQSPKVAEAAPSLAQKKPKAPSPIFMAPSTKSPPPTRGERPPMPTRPVPRAEPLPLPPGPHTPRPPPTPTQFPPAWPAPTAQHIVKRAWRAAGDAASSSHTSPPTKGAGVAAPPTDTNLGLDAGMRALAERIRDDRVADLALMLNPIDVARTYACKTLFLEGVGVDVDVKSDRSMWLGITMKRLVDEDGTELFHQLADYRPHITLFYWDKVQNMELRELGPRLAQRIQNKINAYKSKNVWKAKMLECEEGYAATNYAWCVIEVHCPLHETLHALSKEANIIFKNLSKWQFKTGFHLSVGW